MAHPTSINISVTSGSSVIDITQLVTAAEWSGSLSEVARKLTFGIVTSPTDKMLPSVSINLGDMIMLESDTELFRGYVFTRSKSHSGDAIEVLAYDGLIYLSKSKAPYNISKLSPDQIATKICNELGVPIGQLASTGTSFSSFFENESYYEIIKAAYASASAITGKTYKIKMIAGKLSVIEVGITETMVAAIHDSTFSESIENLVTKVKLLNESGKQVREIASNDTARYGTIVAAYKSEKGKDPVTEARSLLTGPEYTASLVIPGDVQCVTGNRLIVNDVYTGISGAFWIASDTHNFSEGQYTTSMELAFKEAL